jgi:hypothetical protein
MEGWEGAGGKQIVGDIRIERAQDIIPAPEIEKLFLFIASFQCRFLSCREKSSPPRHTPDGFALGSPRKFLNREYIPGSY